LSLGVLIIDDNQNIGEALSMLLNAMDIPCQNAQNPEQALDILRKDVHTREIGLVIQDMNFQRQETSGEEGVELFRSIKCLIPDLPVLLITAWSSVPAAVQMMREGAEDYLQKPWDDHYLVHRVQSLLNMSRLSLEKQKRDGERQKSIADLRSRFDLCGLIFADIKMVQLVDLATRIAKAEVPVLITGPNGSGKEKIAEIVQANSGRTGKPFVRVNVGGLPDDLMESELFGHEAGAFTGAARQRIGRFEAAHGGTLFLDEIGNLTATGQQKLLRVLQTGEFERLGSSQTRSADVRVISATNVNLEEAIEAGTFRADLYYRLNVIELSVPSLAERQDDILPLADAFLETTAETSRLPMKRFSTQGYSALQDYSWPGNVRELKNKVERAMLTSLGDHLEPSDLGFGELAGRPRQQVELSSAESQRKADIEKTLIQNNGIVSHAADQLGISRQALYRQMEKLGIEIQRAPKLKGKGPV